MYPYWLKHFSLWPQFAKSQPEALRNDALEKAKKAAEIQARIQATMMSAGLGGLKLPPMPGIPQAPAMPKVPATKEDISDMKSPPSVLTKWENILLFISRVIYLPNVILFFCVFAIVSVVAVVVVYLS